MTTGQERTALTDRLGEVLGVAHATTLMSMLAAHDRDDLATKADLSALREELRGEMSELRTELRSEMSELRTEVTAIRQEMDLKFATKDDLLAMRDGFDSAFHSYVRTFIATQAATVVGVTGIVYALTQLT